MQKRIISGIHTVSGLVLGLFILLMSLSGAVLVFHDDLDRLQFPESGKQTQGLELNTGFEALKKAYPFAKITNCIPGNPMLFTQYDSAYKSGTAPMQVFLDPASRSILKTRGGSDDLQNNFLSWLATFHSTLGLGKTGEWLLGFFALVFLLSILTGIVLYRKSVPAVLLFRRSAYKRPNLHQLIGVYALLFNLMIAISGFWMQRYVFKKEFYSANDYIPVLRATPVPEFNIDSALHEIQQTYPDFTPGLIYFSQTTGGKTAVYGSRSTNSYVHSKKMADVIALDSTGKIANTRFVREIDPADRYDIINSQLHMGRFGGAGIKILYFIFGLSGAFLGITGFLLWLRRQRPDSESPINRKSV